MHFAIASHGGVCLLAKPVAHSHMGNRLCSTLRKVNLGQVRVIVLCVILASFLTILYSIKINLCYYCLPIVHTLTLRVRYPLGV